MVSYVIDYSSNICDGPTSAEVADGDAVVVGGVGAVRGGVDVRLVIFLVLSAGSEVTSRYWSTSTRSAPLYLKNWGVQCLVPDSGIQSDTRATGFSAFSSY